MARRARILVFHKGPISKGMRRSASRSPVAVEMREAAREHERSVERLREVLSRLPARVRYASLRDNVTAEGYDLVVALGGDGTVLHASHNIGSTPVLALNSAPRYSVGFLTAGTVHEAEGLVVGALERRLPPTPLQRMTVQVNGQQAYGRVLNDVLFTHECPASTARYVLRLGEVEESQTSSGIWVGPAAGSTAAQRAAGGRVLPPRSRKLQFVVREPYLRHGVGYRLVKGLVPPGERLEIRSMMDSAQVYVDGPHVVFPVCIGETVTLTLSDEPLTMLGYRGTDRPD